jgi:hypothetical protein
VSAGVQRIDVIQRGQLVGGAAGRRVIEVAIQLPYLQAQRTARGLRVALQALVLAGKQPVVAGHGHRLAADDTRCLGLLGVPLVGVPAQVPSLCRMNSRVSISCVPNAKFFMSTLPFGKSKSLLPLMVMRWPSGNASQRA